MTDQPTEPPPQSWESLQRRREQPAPDPLAREDTPDELVWRALSAGTGADLLQWLRSETIERRARPGATEAELRELEAQRSLVFRLETMRDRGAEISRQRNAAKAR